MTTDEPAPRIENALRARGITDAILCEQALALASELEVPPLEVGNTLNTLGIKVRQCQLGCFGWRKK